MFCIALPIPLIMKINSFIMYKLLSKSIEAGKWTEKLNSILFDKIQVTVCVAFEDGTSKTQTIAIAAAASDANSTYEKGQTQKEKLIQYEMR